MRCVVGMGSVFARVLLVQALLMMVVVSVIVLPRSTRSADARPALVMSVASTGAVRRPRQRCSGIAVMTTIAGDASMIVVMVMIVMRMVVIMVVLVILMVVHDS